MMPPRLTMSRAMLAVLAIAVNCGLVRQAYIDDSPRNLGVTIGGVLLMGNAISLGLYRLVTRRESRRPFLIGFVAHGLVAVAAFVTFVSLSPGGIEYVTTTALIPIFDRLSTLLPPSVSQTVLGDVIGFATVVALLGLPQLAYALFGGSLSSLIAKVASPSLRATEGRPCDAPV